MLHNTVAFVMTTNARRKMMEHVTLVDTPSSEDEEDGVRYQPKQKVKRRQIVLGCVLAVALIAIVVVIAVVATKKDDPDKSPSVVPSTFKAGKFKKAGVAADATICSDVGTKILQKGGNAIDSAIATTICAGVVNPFSCGIGGGGFLLYFNKSRNEVLVYDYREEAPAAATEMMFENKSSTIGPLASGVPGEVKTMFALHQNHSKLLWRDLLEPSIKLAEEGFPVIKPLANAIQSVKRKMEAYGIDKPIFKGLKKLIMKDDGKYLEEGDLYVNKQLGNTLREIAKNPDSFYTGELAKNITSDVKKHGGIITMDDMKNYKVKARPAFKLKLNNDFTMHTMPAPGGGPIIAMIHNIFSGYNFTNVDIKKDQDAFEFWQRLIESMKFSYAQRGLLGDPDHLPKANITRVMDLIKDLTTGEKIRKNKITLDKTHLPSYYGGFWGKDDFGTSHTSIIAENGDAVSTTNTVNLYFGSLFVSESTGIIMNNEMDDFSTPGKVNAFGYPPSPANYIKPGKRPLSSMSPTIMTDSKGNVRLVVGASGGSKIISGTATVIAKYLYLNMALGESVASYRIHNQGIPNKAFYNPRIPPKDDLIQRLKKVGHVVDKGGDCVTQAVATKDGFVYAMSDPRKSAIASGY